MVGGWGSDNLIKNREKDNEGKVFNARKRVKGGGQEDRVNDGQRRKRGGRKVNIF
jgi:hypothetical protein